jgi:hypothetical protein
MKRSYWITLGFVMFLGGLVWMRSHSGGESARAVAENPDPGLTNRAASVPALVSESSSAELLSARAKISQLEARVRELEAELEVFKPRAKPTLGGSQDGRRPWGPEQATGVPDTMQAGDYRTAWASLEADAGPEWLVVDFPKEVEVAQVRVRETLGPGTIFMVSAILADGSEKILWHGTEPAAEAPVEMEFNPSSKVRSRRIRIQLDTTVVKGWNEIDAVELVGTDGTRQWASGAWASSTYADRVSGPLNISSPRRLDRPGPVVATDAGAVMIEQEAADRMELERQTRSIELKKKQDAVNGAVPRPSGE